MDENILVWIGNIIVNFVDFIIFVSWCNNLVENKKAISVKTFLMGGLYGLIFGTIAHVITDGNTVRIILLVATMSIIKWISKRKIHNIFIIYL